METVSKVIRSLTFKFIIFYWFNALVSVILLSSCNEDLLINQGSPINGRVVDYYGNPVSGANVELEFHSLSLKTKSTTDGSFHYSDVAKPYTIAVSLDPKAFQGAEASIYVGLSLDNPVLSVNKWNPPQQRAEIYITGPDSVVNQNKIYNISFFDDAGIYSWGSSFVAGSYMSEGHNWVGPNSISGKVLATSYLRDQNHNIVHYLEYAQRNLTLMNGGSYTIHFEWNDFSPVSSEVFTDFNAPSGSNRSVFSYYLLQNEFYTEHYPGSELITYNTNNNHVLLPIISGQNFRYLSRSEIIFDTPGLYYMLLKDIQPGTTYDITLNPLPQITHPQNNSTDIDTGTIFQYTTDNMIGIYVSEFYKEPGNWRLTLYTTGSDFRFPQLSGSTFAYQSNTWYRWSVSKYFGLHSVDEIANCPLYVNTKIRETGAYFGINFRTK